MTDLKPAAEAAPILPVAVSDGHRYELICRFPATPRAGILWLPAMGVTARKYQAFADRLAAHGIAVALLEWRGFGSSNRRAARDSDWGYRELLADVAAGRAALAQQAPLRWIVGGHSLGAQVGALAAALSPHDYAGYAFAGSGQPWWRTFPPLQRPLLLAAYPVARWVAALCGYFPGDRTGFAGREARGVMGDWSRSGQTGRYAPRGVDADCEAALARLEMPVLGLRFAHDRLVPRASFDYLLAKLPRTTVTRDEIGDGEFEGGHAGHFDWMKDPEPVARRVAAWIG